MSGRTVDTRRGGRAARGQVLVLFALASLVLLGALGLALDGGYDYIQRRAMQNAADAASLAGASLISRNATDTAVTQAVLDAAARNGVADPRAVSCTLITNAYTSASAGATRACSTTGAAMSTLGANYTGVLVRVAEQHRTFIFRALGVETSGTAATAAARVQRPVGVTGGPFMVCGIDTVVVNRGAGFSGGIFKTQNNYQYGVTSNNKNGAITRNDGYDNCQGGRCAKVDNLDGAPVLNDGAYALADAALTPILIGNKPGPVYLIHDPSGSSGINPCNDSSSSFKGINTNAIAYNALTYPARSRDDGTYNDNAMVPPLTTGTVASVSTSVDGINGCQAGAVIDDCIMILPVCDASGPGGTGSNAALAVRSLQAFYVQQTASGSHTGQLVRNYTIRASSDPTYTTGSGGVTVLKLIR